MAAILGYGRILRIRSVRLIVVCCLLTALLLGFLLVPTYNSSDHCSPVIQRASDAIAAKDYASAIRELTEAVNGRQKDAVRARVIRAVAYALAGDGEKAVDDLTASLQSRDEAIVFYADASRHLVQVLEPCGEDHCAKHRSMSEQIRIFPNIAEGYEDRSLLYHEYGAKLTSRARAASLLEYTIAIALVPSNSHFWSARANEFEVLPERTGELVPNCRAIADLDEAIRLENGPPVIPEISWRAMFIERRARMKLHSGQLEEALADCNLFLKDAPYPAHLLRAEILESLGHNEAALLDLDVLLSMFQDSRDKKHLWRFVQCRLVRSQFYLRHERASLALADCDAALVADPQDTPVDSVERALRRETLLRRAQSLRALERRNEAAQTLARNITEFPIGGRVDQALYLAEDGDVSGAKSKLNEAISLIEPYSDHQDYWAEGEARYMLARVHLTIGNSEEANLEHSKAMKLSRGVLYNSYFEPISPCSSCLKEGNRIRGGDPQDNASH